MAQAERRVGLRELIRAAGIISSTTRQPCLSTPSQPNSLTSEEHRMQARDILIKQRQKKPENKNAVLKRIFKSPQEKEKALDTAQWEFSHDELDQALSAVIRNPDPNPGLVSALLEMGAGVNFVDASGKRRTKSNTSNPTPRRRSTVLQQAVTFRKPESVKLLAYSGADQTTLDEGLKAALFANDQACIEELLRHGADLNRFPNALGNAVLSNDQNLVRLLLRAPKALRSEIISSCLSAAVRQNSEPVASLLIAHGADPNFDSAGALNMAIGKEDWKMTLTLVAGPIPLTSQNLQRLLDTVMRLRTCAATLQFLQLLFCCGLPPTSIGLPDLLICRVRKNDTPGSKMMINHGVPTTTNDAECLRLAIGNQNWVLVDAIMNTPIEASHAAAALPLVFDSQGQRHPRTLALLDTLLPYRTEDTSTLQTLRIAIEGGPENLDIVERLLAANSKLLGPAFQYTIALQDESKKAPLTEALLKLGIPQEALDKALRTETQYTTANANKDLSTATVLMSQGACVSGFAL
ncbi:uncharacterized protein EKO05_0006435 [Ascochyta rabiei]|uniref:Uncharacterized protein n=1 Tax=Didymella rabiei TaxID=5454 RepID=A0A162WUB3_DIDRA|nr:uncharacterized protein EKO05_0006435 [Ascochyta rabiei]KZM19208.1 hypothetical protein ST47_g9643 [Ascochyta rabiei]UPX16010.1 hypothetical protein EKO05_0006435 [Ascochyta rabiei]